MTFEITETNQPTDEAFIPWFTCPYCHKEGILAVNDFVLRDDDGNEIEAYILQCPTCDTVLNADESSPPIQITWVTEQFVEERGWIKAETGAEAQSEAEAKIEEDEG